MSAKQLWTVVYRTTVVVTGNQGSIPEREPERRLPHLRKAAGAQITQSQNGEVVTKNNNMMPYGIVIGMEGT